MEVSSSNTKSPIPAISVPMPPSTMGQDDEEKCSAGTTDIGSIIVMDNDCYHNRISGLDDPTVSVYAPSFQADHEQNQSNIEDDTKRRHVWSKSLRRASCGLLLLISAISAVVFLLQSLGNDGVVDTAILIDNGNSNNASNSNPVDPNSANSGNGSTLNSSSDGIGSDDFFSSMNEEGEDKEAPQQEIDRNPGDDLPVLDLVENDDGNVEESSTNVQPYTTIGPQEGSTGGPVSVSGTTTATVANENTSGWGPPSGTGTGTGTENWVDQFGGDCMRNPNTVQARGANGGGNGSNGGNGGNGCRQRENGRRRENGYGNGGTRGGGGRRGGGGGVGGGA